MAEVLKNRVGLTKEDYKGLPSTLCRGCGHDSVSTGIIQACYELGVHPSSLIKMSGIGCSSKSPAYFLNRSHGFNAVHGRAPSVSTGAKLANRNLSVLLVSGDGDSANIGIGQYLHTLRRNADMLYIIENNGTYGLTRGQFSATADYGVPDHYGQKNLYPAVDLAQMAIELGASFVARSFSGDRKQLIPLIKAGLCHRGCAVIDVISPCVTFMDHEASTKSYAYVKQHDIPMQEVGFVPSYEEITIDYAPGEAKEVILHDGSKLILKKLNTEYDPSNRAVALSTLEKGIREKNVITGLLYYNKEALSFIDTLNIVETPLKDLSEKDLRPSREAFATFLTDLK